MRLKSRALETHYSQITSLPSLTPTRAQRVNNEVRQLMIVDSIAHVFENTSTLFELKPLEKAVRRKKL